MLVSAEPIKYNIFTLFTFTVDIYSLDQYISNIWIFLNHELSEMALFYYPVIFKRLLRSLFA